VTPWVRRLIIANVIMFFIEQVAPGFASMLVLRPWLVLQQPWTPITYMFLHDPGGITHILFNMLGLYFFGPRVEERLGSRRFLWLYFISGLSGAAASFIFARHSAVLGASGALFGVMLAFARYWPDAQILFFFFLPLPAAVAVLIMVGMSLYAGITHAQTGVAEFCHLGGFAGAWIYLMYLDRTAGVRKFRPKTVAAVPKETLNNWKRVDPARIHEVNRDEVNRILDKISAKGLASLTPQERLFLSNFVPPDDRVPPVT
jgi:membrane associated rhomboid family serine protease